MSNKDKFILIFFIIIITGFIFYLFATITRVDINKADIANQAEISDSGNSNIFTEQLKLAYRSEARLIFYNYNHLIKNPDLTEQQLNQTKEQLLSLKVPGEYKDLHIKFVLAVTMMEKYLQTNNNEDKLSSQELINKIKENYTWLAS